MLAPAGKPEAVPNLQELREIAVCQMEDKGPNPVGSRRPNAWGLHDHVGQFVGVGLLMLKPKVPFKTNLIERPLSLRPYSGPCFGMVI